MGEVRVREAAGNDALVVAALALQCALHRGGQPEPGFLDRFADAWQREADRRPVWIAETAEEHAGYLQALSARPLPWPGRGDGGGTLLVETFFVRPAHRGAGVGERLLREAVAWAAREDFDVVSMEAGPHTRPLVERIGFAVCGDRLDLRLR